ncbi:MAG: hypothetical protein WBJ23_02410, partial [Anaerolineaceae bacterium]
RWRTLVAGQMISAQCLLFLDLFESRPFLQLDLLPRSPAAFGYDAGLHRSNMTTKAQEAITEYLKLKNRKTHPEGTFDSGGRFYLAESEWEKPMNNSFKLFAQVIT